MAGKEGIESSYPDGNGCNAAKDDLFLFYEKVNGEFALVWCVVDRRLLGNVWVA
jgi:hypothetical protein